MRFISEVSDRDELAQASDMTDPAQIKMQYKLPPAIGEIVQEAWEPGLGTRP
jgi:hypothetical protein